MNKQINKVDLEKIEKDFYGKSKTHIDMNGLQEGNWYDGYYDYSTYVTGEKLEFDFENQCNGFTFLNYITDFRDYLKLCLKVGNYKEKFKDYILKSIKVYNLWILDFLSNVKIEDKSEIIEGDYINIDRCDFGISFDDVLKKEKEILKDKDFFIYLLKKEHLFKNFEDYEFMFYDKESKIVHLQFSDFIFHISYYISNKYENYYYSMSKREGFRYKNFENNLFYLDEIGKVKCELERFERILKSVKNIVENGGFKKYLKQNKIK